MALPSQYLDLLDESNPAPRSNTGVQVTTPWVGSPDHECVRVEFSMGIDQGASRVSSDLSFQLYKPEVVDDLIERLKAAREKLWPTT